MLTKSTVFLGFQLVYIKIIAIEKGKFTLKKKGFYVVLC